MKTLFWRIIGLILVLAQVVISVMCATSFIRMGIFEQWLVCLVVGLLIILVVLCAIPVFIKEKLIIATRILCMVVSVAIVTGGIFAFRYTSAFNNFLDKVSLDAPINSGEYTIDITKSPFILYISGSDSHTSVDDPEARSDVNIIVVVNPKKEKILLASIPRDTYLQLHGTTGLMDKLTHAGYNNNIELSKLTLEDFLEIEIDYTVKVSFDTVVQVVDQLDGIDIYSDTALWLKAESKTDPNKYCSFVIGVQHVDGDCALRFARERKSYSRGDKHRGENQQEVLTGIINKLSGSKDYVMKLPEILEIAGNSFETSFMREDITKFIRFQLANDTNWQVESIGLDGGGDMMPTYTYGEDTLLWVMWPDEDSLQQVKDKINEYLMTE